MVEAGTVLVAMVAGGLVLFVLGVTIYRLMRKGKKNNDSDFSHSEEFQPQDMMQYPNDQQQFAQHER